MNTHLVSLETVLLEYRRLLWREDPYPMVPWSLPNFVQESAMLYAAENEFTCHYNESLSESKQNNSHTVLYLKITKRTIPPILLCQNARPYQKVLRQIQKGVFLL